MTDLLTDLPILDSEGSFRFQNQKVLLTYKTHLDKDKFADFITKIAKGALKCIYIAHENGKDDPITPYEHTHAVINFGKSIQSRNANFLDFDEIHPHISIIKTPIQWKKACKYICKEDSTVVLEDHDNAWNITEVWGHGTVAELFNTVDY